MSTQLINGQTQEESREVLIHQYIKTVQQAAASLSIVNDDQRKLENQSFLVFEILFPHTRKNINGYFRVYVSKSVYSKKILNSYVYKKVGKYKTVIEYYRNLVKNGKYVLDNKKELSVISNQLKGLFKKYEREDIEPAWGTTGIIYEAWKKGLLLDIGNNDKIKNALFFNINLNNKIIAEELKRLLKLDDWEIVQPKGPFLNLEEVFVHRMIGEKPGKAIVVHFPLIVDGFWFVGQAYLVKVGRISRNPPMLFDKDSFLRCYDLLVNTVAEPLKRVLRSIAIDSVETNLSLDNATLKAAKNYFACFDVEPCTHSQKKTRHESPNGICFYYNDCGIKIKTPFGHNVNEQFKNHIKKTLKDEIDKLKKDIKKKWDIITSARKSAVAAVMSRNMSHNIGSHVLSSLAHEHSLLDEQSKTFLKYLQTRMEFIADVSTTEPVITFPSRMKSDIMEKFFEPSLDQDRRNEWPFYLVKYISGSKDISFDLYDKKKQNLNITFDGDESLHIALPNDILGAQAFYIILENIIRNSAKHSQIPEVKVSVEGNPGEIGSEITVKKLELKVKVDRSFRNNSLIKVIIWDNLGLANKTFRGRTDFDIKESTGRVKKMSFAEYMNFKVARLILEDGKLRQSDWGILEMKICAGYLRKQPLIELDNLSDPILLNVVLDNDANIGYELYLLKPKLALILVKDIPNAVNVSSMASIGVDVVKGNDVDLSQLFKYGTEHEYLVVAKEIWKERTNGLGSDSNQQTLVIKEQEVGSLLVKSDLNDFRLELFKRVITELKDVVCVDNKVTETPNQDSIIFDDHAKCRETFNNSWPDRTFYYEPYGSQSPTNSYVQAYKISSGDVKEILKHELNLAAKLSVGILDERIQRSAEGEEFNKKTNNGEFKLSKKDILMGMNICVPTADDFDLYANSYHEMSGGDRTIADKVNAWLDRKKIKCDYLVLHQGVIEKTLNSTDPKRIGTFIKDLENNGARVIVISGRGKPSNLPDNIFYLPFSLVNQYVISYRSKIYLHKLLKSARRYRHG